MKFISFCFIRIELKRIVLRLIGRKRSGTFSSYRNELYRIYEQYEVVKKRKRMYDEMDLVIVVFSMT